MEFKLPWRKAGLLISMIKWTRISRLSIKISLSSAYFGPQVRYPISRKNPVCVPKVLPCVGPMDYLIAGYQARRTLDLGLEEYPGLLRCGAGTGAPPSPALSV